MSKTAIACPCCCPRSVEYENPDKTVMNYNVKTLEELSEIVATEKHTKMHSNVIMKEKANCCPSHFMRM